MIYGDLFQESRKFLGENNFWFYWERRFDLLWFSCFSAPYWYIYWRVQFYILVVSGLLRSFHGTLLVLIKSGWPEFFMKSTIFWSLRSTCTKGTYSWDSNSIRTHLQKGKSQKVLYMYNYWTQKEKKKKKEKKKRL